MLANRTKKYENNIKKMKKKKKIQVKVELK